MERKFPATKLGPNKSLKLRLDYIVINRAATKMPKAKTQENKENAPAAAETKDFKLEEGKGDEDTGSEDDDDDDDDEEKEPVKFQTIFNSS